MTGPGREREQLGSVGEEATRLFEAMEEWARGAFAGPGPQIATGAAECRLCPLCQLIGLIRDVRPETVEHLLEASTALLTTLRAAVERHERAWATRRAGPVQHIDIDLG